MKKCPYCAEMIQDEAIKCRYCLSDLTVEPPTRTPEPEPTSEPTSPVPAVEAGSIEPEATGGAAEDTTDESRAEEPPAEEEAAEDAPAADAAEEAAEDAPAADAAEEAVTDTVASADGGTATVGEAADEATVAAAATAPASSGATGDVRYTHSGFRYVLGYSADSFGIWDRQSPSDPTERYPRTDDGWRQAWLRFSALEPNNVTVDQEGGAPPADQATPAAGAAVDPSDNAAVQYTHSGTRYLLGYGRTFFGIWDRQAPATPVEKYPRDDAGWAAAWGRFTQIESNFTEVSLGG